VQIITTAGWNQGFLNKLRKNWALFEKYVIRRLAGQNEKS
jgi:hypothetical protein